MAISIKLKGFNETLKKFEKMENNLKDPSRPMRIIGQQGSRDILNHFNETEGPGKVQWKSIKPRRRNNTTKPLNDYGRLRSAMQVKLLKSSVELIKNIKYAHFHENGTKNIAKRKFMYLSQEAKKVMTNTLMRYITGAFK